MDQIRIGTFLAELRREKGLTQEQLGEKLGVTNKTVSRWENGNYMPDLSMLQTLAETLGVSVSELLLGERVPEEARSARTEEAVRNAAESTVFSVREKMDYWKSKWRQDHYLTYLITIILLYAAAVLLWIFLPASQKFVFIAVPVIQLLLILYWNNSMMIYTEEKVFGKIGAHPYENDHK